MKQGYVAGFLFDEQGRVLLVRKNRPAWQAGKLNGIGGKIENDETSETAMQREFKEEAGLDIAIWEHFATVTFEAGYVDFYRATVTSDILENATTIEDEEIGIYSWPLDASEKILPNLAWLIPLALYTHDRYEVIVAKEIEGDNTLYNT